MWGMHSTSTKWRSKYVITQRQVTDKKIQLPNDKSRVKFMSHILSATN